MLSAYKNCFWGSRDTCKDLQGIKFLQNFFSMDKMKCLNCIFTRYFEIK